MKIVSCYKWVYDEDDVKVDSAGNGINTQGAATKLSLYDKNSLEASVKIIEDAGEGSCVALSYGTDKVLASKKEVLSRGPDAGYVVNDPTAETADPYATARVLAAAIRHIGEVDLVIAGEGASDDYAQQVGPRIAQELGIPVIAYATSITIEGSSVLVDHAVDEGVETVRAQMPVVVTMQGDCNAPRIPSLKQILGAGKKPFEEISLSDLGFSADDLQPKAKTLQIFENSQDRKKMRVEGDATEAAEQLIRSLIQECVL